LCRDGRGRLAKGKSVESLDDPALQTMNANELIFKETMRETRQTLADWGERPIRIVGLWALISLAIAVSMLSSVLAVSHMATPDPGLLPNLHGGSLETVGRVMFRNSLVLALHAFICVAGFMAMRTLPQQVLTKSGIDRWIHQHAGRFAMLWVTAATIFSITTQIYILGHYVADIAVTINVSQAELLLTVLPHALLELTAVFLPLAAFLIASKRGDWHQLLAATVVTVAVAVPAIIAAAFIEAYLWPHLLRGIVA
jgi:hypothetical protein